MKLISIALGGATGALLRYGVALALPRVSAAGFPWATIAVNLSGSFLIGLLGSLAERALLPPHLHAFVLIGVLGAFTTFSTFMFESLQIVQQRSLGLFVCYITVSNVLGLLLVLGGFAIGRKLV